MLPFELLLLVSALLAPAHCASRQSFCKCVCGYNSTIIPLDGKPLDPPPARKYRLSSISSSTGTATSSSSSSSASTTFDLPLPPGSTSETSRDNDGIYDSEDQGFDITGYAGDVSRNAEPRLRMHEREDEEPGTDHGVTDPLAHAQTAALDEFGTTVSTTGTPTSSAPSSTATAAEEDDESTPGNSTDTQLVSPQRAGTCADCNRQFCLEHPDFDKMCGEAKEEEVFTTCFQRDSAKDQVVVYTFIIVTVGLLGYATIRPWIDRKYEAVRERRSYAPVSGGPGNG